MRPESIHLTLAFLGDVELVRLERLQEIAAAVRAPAFDLEIDQVGWWPHNHIVWAGVAGSPALQYLVAQLQAGLRGQNTAVDREKRPFFPHITLLRKAATAATAALPARPDLPLWSCAEFVLVRSLRDGGSAAYECLRRFPLERAQT